VYNVIFVNDTRKWNISSIEEK